nr:hypothetical protein [Micromonospora sp. DSM 115978]
MTAVDVILLGPIVAAWLAVLCLVAAIRILRTRPAGPAPARRRRPAPPPFVLDLDVDVAPAGDLTVIVPAMPAVDPWSHTALDLDDLLAVTR